MSFVEKMRPILFSGQMVRAILRGEKTETRRLATNKAAARITSGDVLWVRESWSPADEFVFGCEREEPVAVAYRADYQVLVHEAGNPWEADTTHWNWDRFKWKPGIHMPKWAARIRLRVVIEYSERLQNISYLSARWEGTKGIGEFAELWDKINRAEGTTWQDNPMVKVVQFVRLPMLDVEPAGCPSNRRARVNDQEENK